MTYDEDHSQVRTASGPRVMASLRNLAITILRLSRSDQHRRRPALPRPPFRPATTDDHEVLTTLPRPWGTAQAILTAGGVGGTVMTIFFAAVSAYH